MKRAARWLSATDLRLALTIGGGALVLRAAWVLSVRRHGFAMNDTLAYDLFALQLAAGHGFTNVNGAPSAAWPPGYPFVLSIAFRIFGSAEVVGRLLNAVVGAATVPLLYLIARRAFGRREAVFAASALAVFPSQIILTDVLLSETLNTFLIVALLALLAVSRPTRRSALLSGLLIGAATLTRGENLLLVLVPLVVWWPALAPRLRIVRLGTVLAAAAVVVLPWTVRNIEQLHSPIFVSDNLGQSLYAGNNPHANGGPTFAPASLIAKAKSEPAPRSEVDRNRILTDYAERWALHHPAQELLLIPERLLALVGDDAGMMSVWIDPGATLTSPPAIGPQGTARLSLILGFAWYALLAGFIATLVLSGRRLWKKPRTLAARTSVQGALTWIVVSACVYCVVLFGDWRYHISFEPLMILVCAPAACAAWGARASLADRFSGQRALRFERSEESW